MPLYTTDIFSGWILFSWIKY